MARKKTGKGREPRSEVGYGSPPREHQFRKRQSGNLNGRPRGAKGVSTLVLEAANAPIRVTENGRTQKTTVLNAAVKQQALKAAGGDPRATDRLIAHVAKAEEAKNRERPEVAFSEADRLVIAEIYQRMKTGALRLGPPCRRKWPFHGRRRNSVSALPNRPLRAPNAAQAMHAYRFILQQDFFAFVHRALITLYPNEHFHSNFHNEIIAAAVDDILAGRCTRLLLCQPPRNLKSVIMSVCLPAFILGHRSTAQIIVASYSQEFAEKLSRDCRTLMESDFYQRLFPTRLSADKNTAAEFETTAGGFRLATSITGTLTGRGADFIIVDDPLKAVEAHSQPARTAVNEWFDGPLLTRLTHKNRGVVIVTMQRLHEDDLAGHILEKGGWKYLGFPAIATEREEFHIDTPFGPKAFVRNVGDVLHPERESRDTLDNIRREMGDWAYEAQYQQSPVPRGGLFVKAHWFRDYEGAMPLSAFDEIVFSCDTANKASELADYSVIIICGIKDELLYIIEMVRERLAYPDLRQKLLELARWYNPSAIVIEDHASGTPLSQDLKLEGLYQVVEFRPVGDKTLRLHTQSASIKNGLVFLPEVAHWRMAFIREICSFPNSRHDDQVDALTQLIAWYRQPNSFRSFKTVYGGILKKSKQDSIPRDAQGNPPTIAMRAPHNLIGTSTDLHRHVKFPPGGTVLFFEEEILTLLKNGWTKVEND